jgi:hypothetical protein
MMNGRTVETYARSMVRTLRELGHAAIETTKTPPVAKAVYKEVDFLLDIDCGRDDEGKLRWHGESEKPAVKSIVYLIDSHGNPTAHRRLARNYDHVFFAVWDKRDLFAEHPSAHWCPNFTDLEWFNPNIIANQYYDFGFFGSKGGLERANKMKDIAKINGWSATAREVGRKHRWPQTANAMGECRILFNKSQKHDGPNLRVMESMAMKKPLITDVDPRSGLEKLFEPWAHFIPYNYDYSGLEEAMIWAKSHPDDAAQIAQAAYERVASRHLVKHRIEQIIEIVDA